MSLSRDLLEQRLVEAYVDAGPEMVELLEAKTPVQFYAVPGMPDYHPEFPGGSPGGGRTLECPIYPFDELGEWADRVTPSPYFADPHITMSETPLGKAVPEPPSPEEHERRRVAQRARVRPGARRPAAARVPGPRHRAPHVVCRSRADARRRRGRRRGRRHAGRRRSRSRRRRASCSPRGGFEWNDDLRRAFLRGPMTHPVSMETSTGDGLLMAMKAGAMITNMREAWWIPVGDVPVEDEPAGADPGQRPAHAAPLDHGQPARAPVHQRGRELQRLRRRLPRRGRLPVRVRQPAVLAGVRPELRRHVRVPRRGRRRRRPGAGVGAARRHAGRAGGRPRHRRRGAGADGRAVERSCASRATIPTSAAATARSTAGGATRTARAGATPRSARSTAARSTPTRSTAARSAPRAARGSIRTPGCSTSTASRSPACTPRAT